MKAIVNDKKHITLVSHTNGVTIIEASGCIIDLDYQCLASICEISDIDNSYTIAESNRISELENTIAELEINVSDKAFKISQLEDKLNVASSNSDKDELTERIEFLEKHIAREAIDELRNCISPMDIFRKYLNDIIEYNIDSMTVYFVEATSPTVIRKFGDNGFIINCRNNREAEIINTLINCNIPVNDVISTYNSYIVSTSIY